ncbi:MAG TPA: superoxide dismutase family protein, partial [Pseudonocardiaceae bacterium]|nr:superoxide dismutase family protein [Pseudonocardiaceae bacterium]
AVAGVTVALGLSACSANQSPAPTTSAPPPTSEEPAAVELSGQGTLAEPGRSSNAFTYDPTLAPAGATLTVTLTPTEGATKGKLDVSGLQPNRGYAVHLHAKPCGRTGDAAGPHFQHKTDPAATPDKPSTDPKYANPDNEVWLDVRTDGTGAGSSTTEVPFVFTDRAPASVVVHEAMKTATGPGEAGNAGGRVACFTLPNK